MRLTCYYVVSEEVFLTYMKCSSAYVVRFKTKPLQAKHVSQFTVLARIVQGAVEKLYVDLKMISFAINYVLTPKSSSFVELTYFYQLKINSFHSRKESRKESSGISSIILPLLARYYYCT